MKNQIEAVIEEIREVQSFGSKGFKKQEIIVRTIDKHPQTLPLEFSGKTLAIVEDEGLQVGDKCLFHININGREWNGKYFVSLAPWKVEVLDKTEREQDRKPEKEYSPQVPQAELPDDSIEDLPF